MGVHTLTHTLTQPRSTLTWSTYTKGGPLQGQVSLRSWQALPIHLKRTKAVFQERLSHTY